MPKAYRDPTADLAIANVERERKIKAAQGTYNKQKHKPKTDRAKNEPVDWRKLLSSDHKRIKINRAWLMYDQMLKMTGEHDHTD